MSERDDTPGTAQEDVTEDARILNSDPDAEAIDEPTVDSEQEARETVWMLKEGTTIAVISILALLVLAVALMQATGVVNVLAPLADTGLGQWAALGVLALVVVAVFAWSRWGV